MRSEPVIERAAALVRQEMEDYVPVLSPINFNADNLQGACGISSRVLHRALRRLGVQNDFVMGRFGDDWGTRDTHCWVEIPRLRQVVDVTATQFGIEEPVYIGPIDHPYISHVRNVQATNRLRNWEGQSHIWYLDRLKEMEDLVVKVCQREFSGKKAA